jgi:hypothetical protein
MHVRLATVQDAPEVSALRLNAYSKASEFRVALPDALTWSETDEKSVLGVWSEDEGLISTLKGTLLPDRASATSFMECELPAHWTFPTLLLGKGATSLRSHHKGYHSTLRRIFLEAAEHLQIPNVTGIVFEGAPRTESMRRLGYDFTSVSRYWFEDLVPTVPVLLAKVDIQRYRRAIELIGDQEHKQGRYDNLATSLVGRQAISALSKVSTAVAAA